MKKTVQPNSLDLAPNFERSWLEMELIPAISHEVTSQKVEDFQRQLAEICGMHIFCGPIIVSPDKEDSLLPYYMTNKRFKPRDWNAYTWWTRRDASNVLSILNHSHESFYYYPEHNLIDISIVTCSTYDLMKVVKFAYDYWKPNEKGIRYAFLSPKFSGCSWEVYQG